MNGSLFFSKVDETHTGSYTCTPYNELGTDGPSPIIHVIVLRPPIFTQRPKQIYIHKLGEDVHFTCEAADRDGHHRPTVSWARVSTQFFIYVWDLYSGLWMLIFMRGFLFIMDCPVKIDVGL